MLGRQERLILLSGFQEPVEDPGCLNGASNILSCLAMEWVTELDMNFKLFA